MPRISLIVPEDDLALIDEVAAPNRTAFMVAASREAALRARRERDDRELAAILDASADADRELLAEFDGTAADGIP
jgi:hypothetical protein